MCESYLIRGATVADGSGGPLIQADVTVSGGRIIAVGKSCTVLSPVVIDAGGLVLSPGFIDIHSHTDATIFRYPLCESKVFQGVTVEVTGNCGLGLFPVQQGQEEQLAGYLGIHDFHLPKSGITWHDFASYADEVDSHLPGIHLAPLVGHAALRIAAMGMENRPPTAAELDRMQELLAQALRQGAWGISTGLIYPPGSYAATDELIALTRTVAASGGLYASHIRNEGEGLMAALGEAITIGRESGGRIQVSHLKAMGRGNRGKGADALAALAAARAAGVDIAADQYPYAASATSLTAVVPPWAHDGGVAALLERLGDPALRERLLKEIGREMGQREGASGIVVSNCCTEQNRRFSGQSLQQVAATWHCTPEEAVLRLITEEAGGVGAIFFSMAEDDVATIMADPLVAVGSDGHGLSLADAVHEATHPRSYGTFPRVLGRFARDEKRFSLAAAIHKMTGLPAARLGFTDRGLVKPGYAADLVLFDPSSVADLADYADCHRYSTGIVHLLMDGTPVIRDGKHTGIRKGKVLRKGGGQ